MAGRKPGRKPKAVKIVADKSDNIKTAMIQALELKLGIVTEACLEVGISRDTHYRWMKEDEKYHQNVLLVHEASIDFVESALFKRIREGSDASTIFFLKCRARNRGYIEKQETEHSGEIKITVEEKRIS